MRTRQIAEITRRARTLREHLSRSGHAAPPLGQKQLQRWIDLSARGDDAAFARLLAFDGFTPPAGSIPPCARDDLPEGPLPEWARVIRAFLSAPTEVGDDDVPHTNDFWLPRDHAGWAACWQALFAPCVAWAERRVVARVGVQYDALSREARAALKQDLLISLLQLGRNALNLEFQVHRLGNGSTARRLADPRDRTEQVREYARAFHQDGGLARLLDGYPVLARLVGVTVRSWVDSTAELITRVHEDWPQLRGFVGVGDRPEILSVEPRLSDRHNGGRTVAAIRFSAGVDVVYKPRNLAIEVAFNAFVTWLNACGAPLELRTCRVLDCGTHGWAEFVPTSPPSSPAATDRYFYRCGMLLGVAHMLRATDLHRGNLVSDGEHPVLVDLETLMHPNVRDEVPPDPTLADTLNEELDSVLRTGLLPCFDPNAEDWRWNVAAISSRLRARDLPDPDQGPGDEQRPRPPWQAPLHLHWKSVIDGFSALYERLVEQRPALLHPDGPLRAFENREIRFVFRATQRYADLQRTALRPESLRNGIEMGITLEALTRVGVYFADRPGFWPLVHAERASLTDFDIPHFGTRTDQVDLVLPQGTVLEKFFIRSGLEDTRNRVQTLSADDLQRQVSVAAGSLLVRTACQARHTVPLPSPPDAGDGPETRSRFAEAALAIGIDLLGRRICLNGHDTWVSPAFAGGAVTVHVRTLADDLYSGSYGVALFFAALGAWPVGEGFADAARAALPPLRRPSDDTSRAEGSLGACSGLGSAIYALTRIAGFLRCREYVIAATQAAEWITDDLVRRDRRFDVFSGSAGAILGLLSLYRSTDEAWILERAVRCGRHLVESRVEDIRSGLRTWATLRGRLLTGYSHGAAGISHALLRLSDATGEARFREAAREAIAYENTLYVPERSNWADAPEDERQEPLCTWCHGAPGIGLSRLDGCASLDRSQTEADVDAAIRAVARHPLQRLDHLCCGNLGRAEFLLSAARKLHRPDLEEEASLLMKKVLARGAEQGAFGYGIKAFVPGLFQGAAGVGYQLLRFAAPERLPCLLLWE